MGQSGGTLVQYNRLPSTETKRTGSQSGPHCAAVEHQREHRAPSLEGGMMSKTKRLTYDELADELEAVRKLWLQATKLHGEVLVACDRYRERVRELEEMVINLSEAAIAKFGDE